MIWTDPTIPTNIATLEENLLNIFSPADLGLHDFTITVDSANFPGLVTDLTVPFQVQIVCPLTGLAPSVSPAI